MGLFSTKNDAKSGVILCDAKFGVNTKSGVVVSLVWCYRIPCRYPLSLEARPMAKKLSALVAPNLRIREDLRRRLEREAKRRGVSLNAEMTHRLERSFELDAARSNESIAQDIEQNWLRFGERFLALTLEDDLARALAKSNDQKVAALAGAWLKLKERSR
jgi:hypothetical protein